MRNKMPKTCDFCYHHCNLAEGQTGLCNIRENKEGNLITRNYGNLVAISVDPVEKKPLYHFHPNSKTYSVAMFGCNLSCRFCQNYAISQKEFENTAITKHTSAEQVVSEAKRLGCPTVSFTYSEPLVWQDYMIEVAKLAKTEGLGTIMVTNGSFSEEALERLLPLIDAYNIDLKGDEAFYQNMCGGAFEPVLHAIKTITNHSSHIEVTTMVMRQYHDEKMIEYLAEQLSQVGVLVWHLTRYFPRYKENSPETEESYLRKLVQIAKTYEIPYIYPGNSTMDQNTYCPTCQALLLERTWSSAKSRLHAGACPECNSPIYGNW